MNTSVRIGLWLLALIGGIYSSVWLYGNHHVLKSPVDGLTEIFKSNFLFKETERPRKRALCGFGIDVDAVSAWINTAGGASVEITDISRGIWGGTVGVDRMLRLLNRYNIQATFFVPGHTLESFPASIAKIRDAGHEIGLHGYTHEYVSMLSKEQERAVMERCVKLITEFTGKYPRGYTAPSWSVSNHTVEILESFGLLYDHSFNHHDSQPYWLPHNPSYVEAHSSTVVEDWMHPMSQLQLSNIIEIPGNWNLDDWPPFNPGPGSQGYVDPDSILNVWKAQFDYYYLESDTFIFPISLHPDVSGKAHVQMMLEKFIEYINSYKGVEWITFEEMATEFKSGRIAGYTINSGVINNV